MGCVNDGLFVLALRRLIDLLIFENGVKCLFNVLSFDGPWYFLSLLLYKSNNISDSSAEHCCEIGRDVIRSSSENVNNLQWIVYFYL